MTFFSQGASSTDLNLMFLGDAIIFFHISLWPALL